MKPRRSLAALALASSVLLLLGEPHAVASSASPGALAATAEAVPDHAVQARIRAVAQARSEDELTAALDELRRASSPDYADLVPQLALFLLTARGEREGMAPALVVDRLGISRRQILRAVEPHLDTSDAALRAQLENLLGAVGFDEIRTLLAERQAPPPAGLVRYMFERSPAEAVAVLDAQAGRSADATAGGAAVRAVEQARAALAAGSLGDDERTRAAAALDELARHPDWWLRAYAAAVAGDHPRLAADEGALRERLANDPDLRVREVGRAAGR